jgi:REP-associated tyrosine transposase
LSNSIKQILLDAGSALLDRLTVRERPGTTCFRFWQEGPGYDRNLNTPHTIEASIDHIHQNPVRRQLCKWPIDWKWSSASWYLFESARQQSPELPLIHGLPLGTLDG